jgi:hypothetical protein
VLVCANAILCRLALHVNEGKNMQKMILATLLALPVMASAAGTNLVKSGSFDNTFQAADSFSTVSSLTGWNVSAKGVNLYNFAGQAELGNQFVQLDTGKNSRIWQNLAGQVTGQVQLSFWYSAAPNSQAKTNGLEVTFGGNVFTVGVEANNTGSNVWQQYTGLFNLTVTGGDTLAFRALGSSNGVGTRLDHVSAFAVTPVPEPETYAMFLAGLAALGFMSRRRHQRG